MVEDHSDTVATVRRFRFGKRQSGATNGANGQATIPVPPAPIGRRAQYDRFCELAGVVGGAPTGGAILVVVGPRGSGKRVMLNAFAAAARARTSGPCAGVVDLAEGIALPDVLERLARDLEPVPSAFKEFIGTLQKYRYRQEHGQSRAMERARTAADLATIAHDSVPVAPTAIAKGIGTAATTLVSGIENPRDLETVKRDFLRGFAELAQANHDAPVVILFANADRGIEDPTASWVRRRLLADAATFGALAVISSETDDALQLPREAPQIPLRLEPLGVEDSYTFVTELIKLSPRTTIARQVIEASDGYPDRLARFAEYFERYPDARKLDELPEDARVFASGGSVLEPFERLEPPTARRLVLCASTLRRFNEPLLRTVAKVAGIPADETPAALAALLDSRMRPPWIAAGPDGWAIAPEIRGALIDECRRLDPERYKALHRAAAGYQRDRLVELDGGQPLPDGGFVAKRPPSQRLADRAYVAVLGDWLYHLMVTDPKVAFDALLTEVVDALFEAKAEAAIQLLEIGPEVALGDEQDAYRRALAEVAAAFRDNRYVDAIGALGRVEALDPPNELLRTMLDHLVGYASVQAGAPAERAVVRFERAEDRLTACEDPRRLRMRAGNLLWLAYHGSRVGGSAEQAHARLDTVDTIAEGLDDMEIAAEAHRVRALVHRDSDETDAAFSHFDAALRVLKTERMPRMVCQIAIDRANVLLQVGNTTEARAELERARQIAVTLEDTSLEANAGISMLRLELKAREAERAAAIVDDVTALRPFDAYTRNDVANAYFEASYEQQPELLDPAVEAYDAAIGLAREPVFLANRGYAHQRLAQVTFDPDNTLRKRAIGDFAEALQRGLADPNVALALAELADDLDDPDASAYARQALILIAASGDPAQRGQETGSVAPELPIDELLRRALKIVDGDVVAELERVARAYPSDPEVHFLLGLAHREASPPDPDGAVPELEEAVRLAGSDNTERRADYLASLADALCAAGRCDDAEKRVNEALEADPRNLTAEAVRHQIAGRRRDERAVAASRDFLALDSPLHVVVGDGIADAIDPRRGAPNTFIETHVANMRAQIAQQIGVQIPSLRGRVDETLGPFEVELVIHGISRRRVELPGAFLAGAEPGICHAIGNCDAAAAAAPWDGGGAMSVVESDAVELLTAVGVPVWDIAGAVAATVDSLIRPYLSEFVVADYAATAALINEWDVGVAHLPALTALLRDCCEAAVPPHMLETALRVGNLAAAREGLDALRAARGDFAAPATEPGLYALARPAVEPSTATVVTVRLGADLDPSPIALGFEREVAALCDTLRLPRPQVLVAPEPELAADAFELAIGPAVRVAATVDGLQTLAGRFSDPAVREATMPADIVVAQLTAALRDDPSLLLTPEEAQEMVGEQLAGSDIEHEIAEWASALRRAVAMRVAIRPPLRDAILAAASDLGARTAATLAERVERRPSRPIPDAVGLGIRDTLQFDRAGTVRRLQVQIAISHRYPSELRVRLRAPDGRQALLHDRESTFGRDLRLTLESIDSDRLEPLIGASAEGVWELHVQDFEIGDVGTLVSWSLQLELEGSEHAPERHEPRAETAPVLDAMRASRLAYALRPFAAEVRLSSALITALDLDEDQPTPTDAVLEPLLPLGDDLGLSLRDFVDWKEDEHLPEGTYEIVINNLRRLRTEVPRFESEGAPEWMLDPAFAVVFDLEACLRSAAGEFADVGAAEQLLDALLTWSPLLVTFLTEKYPVEVLAGILGRLTDFGLSTRDPRILNALHTLDDEAIDPERIDAAAHADRWRTPEVLTERVAAELADRVVDLRIGPNPDAATRIELDEATAKALRAAAVDGEWPNPCYSFEGAGELLRTLEAQLHAAPPDMPAALVTSGDLRRHVRRLVAAQFPRLAVLTRDQIGGV